MTLQAFGLQLSAWSSAAVGPIDISTTYAIAEESIVVIDMVESTRTASTFGWNVVRESLRTLRRELVSLTNSAGLTLLKSIGDGYLLCFVHAEPTRSVQPALNCAEKIIARLREYNKSQSEKHRKIHVRIALHYGEVDVLDHDREGLEIVKAFRIEKIRSADLGSAFLNTSQSDFPEKDYVLCSDRIRMICKELEWTYSFTEIGQFQLHGFSGDRHLIHRLNIRD